MQAREGLRVVTIICANRAYAILKVELARERIMPRWGGAALYSCCLQPAAWRLAGEPDCTARRSLRGCKRWRPDALRWHVNERSVSPPLRRSCPCSKGRAAHALTEIGSPAIDWVALAQVRLPAAASWFS